jgi:hypothetical protein
MEGIRWPTVMDFKASISGNQRGNKGGRGGDKVMPVLGGWRRLNSVGFSCALEKDADAWHGGVAPCRLGDGDSWVSRGGRRPGGWADALLQKRKERWSGLLWFGLGKRREIWCVQKRSND